MDEYFAVLMNMYPFYYCYYLINAFANGMRGCRQLYSTLVITCIV